MQYKAIIFDFFDVIHNDPFQRWLKSRGLKREGDLHQVSVEMDKGIITPKEFLKRLGTLTNTDPATLEQEMASFHGFNAEMIALVNELAIHYQVGLLSNGPSAFVRDLLRKGDIEDTFHHIVISSEVGMVKPEPEMFRHILKKMSVEPNQAVFIDDNPKNVAGAEALGIGGILFTDLPQLKMALKALGVKPSKS